MNPTNERMFPIGSTVAIGKVTKLVENPVDISDNMANMALNGPQSTST